MSRSDDCTNALKGVMTGSKKVRRGPRAEVVDLTGNSDDESGTLSPSRKNAIYLEDEDDEDADEDLKRAIALSMRDMNDAQSQIKDSSRHSKGNANEQPDNATDSLLQQKAEEHENQTPPPSVACFGIPGLDRKQLEAERLARVAKRKAENSISPPPLSRASKLTKSTASSVKAGENESSKMVSAQNILKEVSKSRSASPSSRPVFGPSATPSAQFLDGTVKKTWAFGCARRGDDIKIEEVLQTTDVELAVLSAFQWDTSWLFSKFHNSPARFLLVMQAKEESTKMQYQEEVAHISKIRLCFPPMDGQINCMHSKLMLLFHPTYLRIAIPSANLVPYDWGEQGGVMENTVFIIDLPKISTKDIAESPKTAFFEELAFFLKASTIHDNIITKLSNFDFTQTTGYRFVHTIGGPHTAENWNRTGYCALGRAVSSLGLRTNQPVSVDFVTSSIGSLTEEFIRAIYLSAQGDDGSIDFALRNPKTTATSSNETLKRYQARASDWKSYFKVYYPSEETVVRSKGGRRCAGTICFQEKWFQGFKFPKGILHDCISRRDGLLMHNKMMFIRPEKPIVVENGKVCRGWAYVGSANLSESAWGKLVYDRSSGRPKLNCRNWECGVLVPVTEETSTSVDAAPPKEESTETDIAEVYGRTIPVPMKVPAPLLGSDLRPWYGTW